MTWPGEKQRHSMSSRRVSTVNHSRLSSRGRLKPGEVHEGGTPMVMYSPTVDDKGRHVGGTLSIPTTQQTQKELPAIESELLDMGITFDTGYDTESQSRDWELDWSFKGGKVVPILGGVELHIPIGNNFVRLKNVEERLQRLGVNLKPIWDPANDTLIWVIRRGGAGGCKARGIMGRKVFGGAKVDFCRKPDHDKAGFNRPVKLLSVPPIIQVRPETYSRIENTNQEIPMHIRNKFKTFKSGIKSSPTAHKGAIITDGERYIIVDTQGQVYPRYKSRIQLTKDNKPLRWS